MANINLDQLFSKTEQTKGSYFTKASKNNPEDKNIDIKFELPKEDSKAPITQTQTQTQTQPETKIKNENNIINEDGNLIFEDSNNIVSNESINHLELGNLIDILSEEYNVGNTEKSDDFEILDNIENLLNIDQLPKNEDFQEIDKTDSLDQTLFLESTKTNDDPESFSIEFSEKNTNIENINLPSEELNETLHEVKSTNLANQSLADNFATKGFVDNLAKQNNINAFQAKTSNDNLAVNIKNTPSNFIDNDAPITNQEFSDNVNLLIENSENTSDEFSKFDNLLEAKNTGKSDFKAEANEDFDIHFNKTTNDTPNEKLLNKANQSLAPISKNSEHFNLEKIDYDKVFDNKLIAEFKIQAIENKDAKVTVTLHPEKLGKVVFSIETGRLIITADSKEVIAILKENIGELQTQLKKIEINTGQTPEFNLREGNQNQNQNQQEKGQYVFGEFNESEIEMRNYNNINSYHNLDPAYFITGKHQLNIFV